MFIERESHPYIPWIGLDAKGGERTVAAQRMEVSNADKADGRVGVDHYSIILSSESVTIALTSGDSGRPPMAR